METTTRFARSSKLTFALLALAVLVTPAHADTVRLNGAGTTLTQVVQPYQAEVQRTTGHTLLLVGNGTGKGLADLLDGRCDASLASEPLDLAVIASELAGRKADRSRLQFHLLANDEIVFVVHPSNPVKRLTWEQLRDIHIGKIKNWSEVGGANQPITVYMGTDTGGTRMLVKVRVMGGLEYGPKVVTMVMIKKIAEMVAVDPTGIAGIGKVFADGRVTIVTTAKLERPLGIITLGPPTPAVKSVIDALKAAAAKKK
jgi:phosphate transport system substrate-binding protein